MRASVKSRRVTLALAFVAAAVLAAPGFVLAYTLIGGSLGLGTSGNGFQRDVRVFNNAADAGANNNMTADPAHPGALGAVQAVWKAARAWASDSPLAAKNFDFDFQGTNASNNANANTVGWGTTGCGGGTLAYCETPISDGWRIVMCESWNWEDGPGGPGGNDDIQGVATHELGHALGLGHTASGNCSGGCSGRPTMCAVICSDGVSERTIQTDDADGLQAVYGVIPSDKPVITGLAGSNLTGGTLIINGSNFAPTVNVKFTAGTGVNTGSIPGVVYGVPSTSGGTQIAVVIPAAAQPGNVLVWEPSIGRMSNAFPINVNYVPPAPPSIASFTPADVPAFLPGTITVNGSGFLGATTMTVGGLPVVLPNFTVVNDTTITFTGATPAALGPVPVTVTSPNGTSGPMSFNYVETQPVKLQTFSVALSNSNFSWNFGAGVNDAVYLIVALDTATFDFGGFPVLLNYLPLGMTFADTLGTGSFAAVIPPGFGGVTFYSQVAAFDDISPQFSTSNITSTQILF
jgi:hypothetical protein